ncbi:hypothetical protein POX_a00296 [Penicillium oxalicum]|uniref:Uncharacterized protein n=1 Tax=Penicillium oxalicum (strain 114-2 / CGMCC 5302) TaxID=933388 RepID=S7ZWB8_PENO1|nr:hypothetical protein POX_a00296 [Penicillium oxalicum]EPS34734.1 hypothetical protein PDE_09698 [Penicillium oxalicum 114-2]KAI2793712.1 hypothetical protein POX_a00296 [Penicillium oxalicum]
MSKTVVAPFRGLSRVGIPRGPNLTRSSAAVSPFNPTSFGRRTFLPPREYSLSRAGNDTKLALDDLVETYCGSVILTRATWSPRFSSTHADGGWNAEKATTAAAPTIGLTKSRDDLFGSRCPDVERRLRCKHTCGANHIASAYSSERGRSSSVSTPNHHAAFGEGR